MDAYRHVFTPVKVLLVIALCALAFREVAIPASFGDFSKYWADAQQYWRTQVPLEYTGTESCTKSACHPVETALWKTSKHARIECESCHESRPPGQIPAIFDCMVCHGVLAAKPQGFPQVDPTQHYKDAPCLRCHDPHAPIPMMSHPMPVARKERASCLVCHLDKADGAPATPIAGVSALIDRLMRPPLVPFRHGGRTYCISCHTPPPSMAELTTMVHGKDVSYCPRCHGPGGGARGGL